MSRALCLLVSVALLASSSAFATDAVPASAPDADPVCGTVLVPEEAAAYLAALKERGPLTVAGGGSPYWVPIAPHIVRQSNGSGGLSEARYTQAMADANAHFAGANIQFFTVPGGIDYIDDDNYYTTSTLAEIDQMRQINLVPDAINIYFTENLNFESGGLCGISAFTWSSVQSIAMRNSCTANPSNMNHSTYSHEIGHYFNLFHTHETGIDDELVDGSNCADAGDLLCDTPADPRLSTSTVNSGTCTYTGSATDANGDPYAPDATQLMSYSLKHCRTNFTPEAWARSADTLVNERPNLISGLVGAPAIDGRAGTVALSAPRPNPTAGLSELRFTLGRAAHVNITVYDVRGARVRTIAEGRFAAGEHVAGWDGFDEFASETAAGIYFARLRSGETEVVRKIQRLR